MTTSLNNDRQISIFGIHIDSFTLNDAIAEARRLLGDPQDRTCRYIVTPNVAHTVMLQKHRQFKKAYMHASMVIADGKPLIWASRLTGRPLPERISGSDFVPALLSAMSDCGLTVFLLGAAPGVAETAAERIKSKYPGIDIVGCYSPPFGFETDADENAKIINLINQAQPQLLIIGLGAPKQELWVYDHHIDLKVRLAICAGATIDFLAGHKRRAPMWMRRYSLEWLHRLCSEPKRLSGRYIGDAFRFPIIVLKEIFHPRVESSGIRKNR